MESSTDYGTKEMLILFDDTDENPLENIPEGWEIIEYSEPSVFKGLLNPGRIVCRQIKEK
jgi:hypothetical protein